jgi:Cold shock proteins
MHMSPLAAYEELLAFARRRGEGALRLAMHAAVPQGFRPELLHLLRLNFISDVLNDPVIEADVLLSPLCEDMGGGYVQFDPEIRRLLLDGLVEAYPNEPVPRVQEVANFLLHYIEHLEQSTYDNQDVLWHDYLETQRWVALAFLDPNAAAAQLAAALHQLEAIDDVVARIQIGGLASALSIPLVRYRRLLVYAGALQALGTGQIEQATNLLQSVGDSEIIVGDITLQPSKQFAQWGAHQSDNSATTATSQQDTDTVFISSSAADAAWTNDELLPPLRKSGLNVVRLAYPLGLAKGTVKWYNEAKGFGFIIQAGGGADVFVHHTSIQREGVRSLAEGQEVYFTITKGPKGLQAANVHLSPSAELLDAMQRGRHVLVVLTPAWLESEWPYFHQLFKRSDMPTGKLLPLLLRPCAVPSPLDRIQWLDFRQPEQFTASLQTLLRVLTSEPEPTSTTSVPRPAKVFIVYKRNAYPDEQVALRIFEALREQEHDVLIDQQTILAGMTWVKHIEEQIRASDVLIALLSTQSVQSEMLAQEIALAHRMAAEQNGRPIILPIRLEYEGPYPFSLSMYLDHIQYAFWRGPEDTSSLIEELSQAIDDRMTLFSTTLPPVEPHAPSRQFEVPGGAMASDSPFYIERAADREALDIIKQQGVAIAIRGPQQTGKTSLLVRLAQAALHAGKSTVVVDFQLFDQSTLSTAGAFFRAFCYHITDQLALPQNDEPWSTRRPITMQCTNYIERYVLQELGGPLVLMMDEVDRVLNTTYSTDFFAMLRSWHTNQVTREIWGRLDLVLATSEEPYMLIKDTTQSPFNIAIAIALEDFTLSELAELNRRYRSPLSQAEEIRLFELIGGQPSLVQRALYLVATRNLSTADLFARATDDRGPFGAHLHYQLLQLNDRPELKRGMREVIHRSTCPDEAVFWRLHSAGLVRRDQQNVFPRYKLYAEYFRDRL